MTVALVALALLTVVADDTRNIPAINTGATATAPAVRLPTVAVDNPPIPPTLSNADIIRAVWPDNLESTALAIAYRESRFECCVKTWCCYGLMQIHWPLHHPWLIGELGLTNAYDLYDPWTNAVAGYRLYQKDGWQPWAL